MHKTIYSIVAALFACVPFVAQGADAEAGKRKAEICAACHGADGNATLPGLPSLAGQPAMHTFLQLVQFREKRRRDPVMSPFAEKLTDRDMQDIGAYFAAQKPLPAVFQADAAKAALGRKTLEMHYCGSCHMPNLSGQNHIPRLAGQNYEYLVKQLRGLKAGTRPDIDGTMASAAQALTDQDIENLAHYLAGLK
jgi:cytochrome c553